jgi:hypothetical protein
VSIVQKSIKSEREQKEYGGEKFVSYVRKNFLFSRKRTEWRSENGIDGV